MTLASEQGGWRWKAGEMKKRRWLLSEGDFDGKEQKQKFGWLFLSERDNDKKGKKMDSHRERSAIKRPADEGLGG